MKRYWLAFAAVVVLSFAVLGWTGVRIYQQAPPIPDRVVSRDGDVVIDRGVLTISGERPSSLPRGDAKTSIYNHERASGSFKRAISLPDDVDAGRVNATYRDGVLNVSIARREEAQPKRITVQ